MTEELVAVLGEARKHNPGIGDIPLFPVPKNPAVLHEAFARTRLVTEGRGLAGLEPKQCPGWHSLRRKFASDLMSQPLKVLCELGGLENRRDRAPVLPASRRGPSQKGPR